jgi:hypothetical protein
MWTHAKTVVDYSTTAVILATCVFLVWANSNKIWPPGASVPTAPQSLEGAALKGDPKAPVVIIEYSDYQCPFCAKSERETLPELDQKYIGTGQVQLAFRHHPLSRLHPFATQAAEAAVCAGRLGKFWEMHAALFADPKQLDWASCWRAQEQSGWTKIGSTRAWRQAMEQDRYRRILRVLSRSSFRGLLHFSCVDGRATAA